MIPFSLNLQFTELLFNWYPLLQQNRDIVLLDVPRW
jgi:hypothetical protein